MAYQSGKPIQREISALAAQQGGYFTAKQAEALGYERRRLAYHVDAGNFERVESTMILCGPPSGAETAPTRRERPCHTEPPWHSMG